GSPDYCGQQCGWDNDILVHPTDTETIYVAGICSLRKITNALGGSPTVTDVSAGTAGSCAGGDRTKYIIHADGQALAFAPSDSSILLLASDGGLVRSTDGAGTFSRLNQGIGSLQFYSLCVNPTNSSDVIGGTQDTGVVRTDGTAWKLVF